MPSKRKMAANKKREEARRRKAARRKFLLCLVEGKSEVRALEAPMGAMLDIIDSSIDIRFQIMWDNRWRIGVEENGGDITSKYGVTPDTIEHVIGKTFLTPFFRDSGLYPRDVLSVIHIVDTDGAFVSDDRIVYSADASDHIVYSDNEIFTVDVDAILQRNRQKRENVRKLASLSEIKVDSKTVPYSVFFFSSNLDHFLYGEPNLAANKKEAMAENFSMECCMRPSMFYDMIQDDEMWCLCDYNTSWDMVQQDTNSLQRHSNLGLLLNML